MVPVETVLLLAKDKGKGEGEGMLKGSMREGKTECGNESTDFKCRE